MHQRSATDPFRILRMYDRGLLTLLGAMNDLVEVTAESPTAELIARIPVDGLGRLRELASAPADTEWISFGMNAEAARESLDRFNRGLDFWRAHFGIEEEAT